MGDSTSSDKQDKGFDLELYKSLRGEVASYVEKVPGLWLQKFVLVGGVIAFLVSRHNDLATTVPQGSRLLVAAVLAIPVLAALLDAKILEYGLHARAISRFIATNFPEPPVLGRWESSLWGDEDTSDAVALVRFRSLVTVVVTVIPTVVLIVLAGLVVGELVQQQALWNSLAAGAVLFYLAVTWYVWRKLWPERTRHTEPRRR